VEQCGQRGVRLEEGRAWWQERQAVGGVGAVWVEYDEG
jgi:hypothetical protein